jgi:hypothetical protein
MILRFGREIILQRPAEQAFDEGNYFRPCKHLACHRQVCGAILHGEVPAISMHDYQEAEVVSTLDGAQSADLPSVKNLGLRISKVKTVSNLRSTWIYILLLQAKLCPHDFSNSAL